MENNSNNINSNYPTMSNSEWGKAPFNSKKEKIIPVTVSVTMSKQFYVIVDNYKIVDKGKNEDGSYYEEIECDEETLKQAIKEQINLPQDGGNLIDSAIRHDLPNKSKDKVTKDLKDWCVDDFEVIQD